MLSYQRVYETVEEVELEVVSIEGDKARWQPWAKPWAMVTGEP